MEKEVFDRASSVLREQVIPRGLKRGELVNHILEMCRRINNQIHTFLNNFSRQARESLRNQP